ncbi:MAG: TonB-dependent receptor domain-containing protein, partial [Longimicrobiales bacterium]
MNIGRATARTVGFLAFVLMALPLSAQERGIATGQVVDANSRQPLVSAQIVIDGTTIGGLTNDQGRFRLQNVPVGEQQIRAILLGYEPVTQTITISVDTPVVVDFELSMSAITLDAVVVTATGEQRKRELGNTVATVAASEIVEIAPVNNLSDLLQGRSAGVTVAQSSGTTGMGSRIRIRGSNSISLSNEPLIYIDGVRVENSNGGQSIGLGGQEPTRMDDINPEDIESIEIVKGPAAATLYGTEAANGVIRITTKRGRAGETAWNFWVEQGAVQERNTYPLNYAGLDSGSADFSDFCLLDFEAQGLCTQTGLSSYQVLDDARLSPFDDGSRAQYGFSVRGGSENINYYVSGELEAEDGPYSLPQADREILEAGGIRINETTERPSQIDRVNVRANINAQIAEDATLTVNAGYVSSNLSATGNDNNSFGFLPSAFFGGAFPDDEGSAWGFQRPAQLFGRDALQDIERFTGSVQGSWNPLPWLSARGNVGLDYTNRHDISFFPRDIGVPGQSNLGRKDSDYFNIYQYTVDASATANFDLTSSISSKTSVGTQYYRRLFNGTLSWGIDIVNGAANISAAAETFSNETTTEDKTAGLFIEQQFGLNDRLFVTAAVRADDNSAFGRDFDLIYYPKASLSWIASEEDFFPEIGFLDQFRFRTAWGRSGLQPGSTAAIRTLAADAITDPGDNTISGGSSGAIGNSLLEPE